MLQPMPSLNSSLHLMNPTLRNFAPMLPPGYNRIKNPYLTVINGSHCERSEAILTLTLNLLYHEKVLQ
jgi:hypothetical protein